MRQLYGRRKIKTDQLNITEKNIVEILGKAIIEHDRNMAEIDHLWNVYRGKMPINGKTKEFRENINNIVCENRAMQAVEFYQGYVFGEPIQYTRRGEDESLNDEIGWLNDAMYAKDKISCDNKLAEWMLVAGVSPRFIFPDKETGFNIYSLDPRFAFNVYGNTLGEPVVMSVKFVVREDNQRVYDVYTSNKHFRLEGDVLKKTESHVMGRPCLVEYCLNEARMGVFEPVLTLQDALNSLQSNRMDDVEQFVNSILTIVGGSIDSKTMASVQELGALSLPEGVDAKYLTAALAQADTQVLKEDIMAAITEIIGLPNRNGGSSTSDTGSAVLLRDGWEVADAKAKRIETNFKSAEKEMLRLALNFSGTFLKSKLSVADIGIQFTRRNYENIQSKATVLTTMLNNPKIHPELAFQHCGMFADPLSAYNMSMEYAKEVAKNGENHNQEAQTAGAGAAEAGEES